MTAPDLNALIGSRICHDLISPLGAIGNGVELLSMSGISAAPEIALIAESIENANARIRFYRVAFGSSGREAELGRAETQSILSDMYRGARMAVDWSVDGAQPRVDVKLAFLLIQCAEAALPWGGTVTVTRTPEGWSLTASGDRMKINGDLWHLLQTGERRGEIAASDVHFALAPLAAETAGRQIITEIGETRIDLSF